MGKRAGVHTATLSCPSHHMSMRANVSHQAFTTSWRRHLGSIECRHASEYAIQNNNGPSCLHPHSNPSPSSFPPFITYQNVITKHCNGLKKTSSRFSCPISLTSVWAIRGVRKEHYGGSGTRVGNARRCPALSTEADSSGKQFRSDCTFPSPWRGLCGLHFVCGWVRGFERWGG